MTIEWLSVLLLGLALGFKHATEPDHVVAISTISSGTSKLSKAARIGTVWGIGHTVTLLVLGMILLTLKWELSEGFMMTSEALVGVMIVLLGSYNVVKFRVKKVHAHVHQHQTSQTPHLHFHDHTQHKSHAHNHQEPSYVKAGIIGVVHGIAGSGLMVILVMDTTSTLMEALSYILAFGGGTVLGMTGFSMLISAPFLFMNSRGFNLKNRGHLAINVGSILFGLFYTYQVVIS
ncbi:hypothetical protein [Saccharospirillum sp.]|uniref:hypothetical protein n=1 Tax=Saccharospirillum sp. TaxID=2033801 RepID=UPI0034A0673D